MKPPLNNRDAFFSENEDIELLAHFPWENYRKNMKEQGVEPKKEQDHVK